MSRMPPEEMAFTIGDGLLSFRVAGSTCLASLAWISSIEFLFYLLR